MSRALEWTPAVERDLRRLEPQVRERIRPAGYRFADTGQGDIVKVQGVAREWRLRVGDWRIRFTEAHPPDHHYPPGAPAGRGVSVRRDRPHAHEECD